MGKLTEKSLAVKKDLIHPSWPFPSEENQAMHENCLPSIL